MLYKEIAIYKFITMFSLNIVVIALFTLYTSSDGAALTQTEPKYVFNFPADPQGACTKGLDTLREEFKALSQRLQLIESSVKITTASVTELPWLGTNYVNWGSASCPNQTTMIYTGYAGKASFDNTGGGIDYQCLPKDPEFVDTPHAGQQGNSYIYGVEYWATGINGVFKPADAHNGLPCSVCEAKLKKQTLMIPAKRTCPSGWSAEYEGTLMAERFSHPSPSTFICVNKAYEHVRASEGNQHSGYVIPVEIGLALPDPPYKNGYEVPCVFCSK